MQPDVLSQSSQVGNEKKLVIKKKVTKKEQTKKESCHASHRGRGGE
jgi:hypothetical protein